MQTFFCFVIFLFKCRVLIFSSPTLAALSIQTSTVSACSPGGSFLHPRTAGAVSLGARWTRVSGGPGGLGCQVFQSTCSTSCATHLHHLKSASSRSTIGPWLCGSQKNWGSGVSPASRCQATGAACRGVEHLADDVPVLLCEPLLALRLQQPAPGAALPPALLQEGGHRPGLGRLTLPPTGPHLGQEARGFPVVARAPRPVSQAGQRVNFLLFVVIPQLLLPHKFPSHLRMAGMLRLYSQFGLVIAPAR